MKPPSVSLTVWLLCFVAFCAAGLRWALSEHRPVRVIIFPAPAAESAGEQHKAATDRSAFSARRGPIHYLPAGSRGVSGAAKLERASNTAETTAHAAGREQTF